MIRYSDICGALEDANEQIVAERELGIPEEFSARRDAASLNVDVQGLAAFALRFALNADRDASEDQTVALAAAFVSGFLTASRIWKDRA